MLPEQKRVTKNDVELRWPAPQWSARTRRDQPVGRLPRPARLLYKSCGSCFLAALPRDRYTAERRMLPVMIYCRAALPLDAPLRSVRHPARRLKQHQPPTRMPGGRNCLGRRLSLYKSFLHIGGSKPMDLRAICKDSRASGSRG